MTPDQLAAAIEQHLAALPSRKAGNKSIRTALLVTDVDYWAAHKILVESGRALRGTGKGGSIVLPAPVPQPPAPVPIVAPAVPPNDEAGWYDPLAAVMRIGWFQEQSFAEAVLEVTARQGRRNTGGKWTRPDLAAVGLRKSAFTKSHEVEVWTFEVKRARDLDVSAVYESLAHSRAATHAAVIACYDAALTPAQEEELEVVAAEARRQGVGLYVVVWGFASFDDVDVNVPPERFAPGVGALDDFITVQLPNQHPTILGWVI
jgi:hypothetical protein